MVGERDVRRTLAVACFVSLIGCRKSSPPRAETDPLDAVASDLEAFEERRHASADFSRVPPWSERSGADPYHIAALGNAHRHAVGILRGASKVVLLDGDLHEAERLEAPHGTTGLAVRDEEIVVCGEGSPVLARYRFNGVALVPAGTINVQGVPGLRDVAIGAKGMIYAMDERNGSLIVLATNENAWASGRALARRDFSAGIAPFRVAATNSHVVVDDLLGHALLIFSLDARGVPLANPIALKHDGPIWGFDAREHDGDLFIAAGGVEDRPLDRRDGFFGWIDSFAFVYRVHEHAASRLAAINVSELGVVTPKAVALDVNGANASLLVTGYGGDRAAHLEWRNRDFSLAPAVATFPLAPGTAAIARAKDDLLIANTLLDSWSLVRANGFVEQEVVPNGAPPRSVDSKIGEALFFTTRMAPGATSEGEHSRFTCETCHFEGYVDGRTHFTGRGDVYATTKPLRGLVNNRPHFSRALDPDLATVALNEFRVANAGTGESEWFSLNPADFSWIRDLGAADDVLSPTDLRRAFMTFLMDFSHDENPVARGRKAFTDEERAGAQAFLVACESCHQARTATDVPSSRLPLDAWADAIFSDANPIVWAKESYEKTGVEPYVHESGARVPSLRRLFEKRPYFTNGSARDLGDVLDRVRFSGTNFFHENAPASSTPLSETQKRALAAFLALL